MVSHHQRNAFEFIRGTVWLFVLLLAHAPDGCIAFEQVLRGYFADGQNYFRLDELNLAIQILPASCRLGWLRVAIVGWPALENIGDKNRFPSLANSMQHQVKKLPGATYKGLTAPILFCPWRLTDNHPVGIRIADTEYCLRTTLR